MARAPETSGVVSFGFLVLNKYFGSGTVIKCCIFLFSFCFETELHESQASLELGMYMLGLLSLLPPKS